MIACRPVHHAASRIRYTASPAPLDEGAQPVFEPFHIGYTALWEVVLGKTERGSFNSRFTNPFFQLISGFAYIDS
jgi:hypothetical protein